MAYYLVTVEEYDNEGRGGQQMVCNCLMEVASDGKTIKFVKYVQEVKKPIENLVCSSDINSLDSFKIISFVVQKDYYK